MTYNVFGGSLNIAQLNFAICWLSSAQVRYTNNAYTCGGQYTCTCVTASDTHLLFWFYFHVYVVCVCV